MLFVSQVNFFAKDEYESTQNYKVLQTGFNLIKITRVSRDHMYTALGDCTIHGLVYCRQVSC